MTLDSRYINRYPDVISSRSELAIPIRVGGRVLGLLDIQSERVNAFDEPDSIVMETLVDQIAASIEHARLYGEVQRELEERRKAEAWLVEQRERITREVEEKLAADRQDFRQGAIMVSSHIL